MPEEKDIAKAIKEAMKAIEDHKPELEGVLPQDEYLRLTRIVHMNRSRERVSIYRHVGRLGRPKSPVQPQQRTVQILPT